VRLTAVLRYALGLIPLDSYQLELGKIGTPSVVLEDLAQALAYAIDELTRPIDAIKHQAKTVTVGISRADETLLQSLLVKAVLAAGTPRERLTYRTLRTLGRARPGDRGCARLHPLRGRQRRRRGRRGQCVHRRPWRYFVGHSIAYRA
jgi:glucosamine--fructose-6-phosphate aminotransferase (isomerizing)